MTNVKLFYFTQKIYLLFFVQHVKDRVSDFSETSVKGTDSNRFMWTAHFPAVPGETRVGEFLSGDGM